VIGVVSGGDEIGMRCDDLGAEGTDGRDGRDGGADSSFGDDEGSFGADEGAITVGASPKFGEDSGRGGAFTMTAVVSRGERERGGGEGRPVDAQPEAREDGFPEDGPCIMLTGPGMPDEGLGPPIDFVIAGFSHPCCFFCSPGKSVSTSCARRAVTSPGDVRVYTNASSSRAR